MGVVVGFLLASAQSVCGVELLVLFSEHPLSSSGGGKGAREGHGGEEVQLVSGLAPRLSRVVSSSAGTPTLLDSGSHEWDLWLKGPMVALVGLLALQGGLIGEKDALSL